MNFKPAIAALLAGSSLCAVAHASDGGLSTAPGGAATWTIVSAGGKHGEEQVWTDKNGVRHARMKIVLRGLTYDVDHATVLGEKGIPASITIRGVTPSGDAGESFAIENGVAIWKSPADAGEAPWRDNLAYVAFGGPQDTTAILIAALLADADGKLDALPGGAVKISELTTATVKSGARTKTLKALAIEGASFDPQVVWVDESNRFFATVGWLSWLPKGWEGVRQQLIDAETEALAARAPALRASLIEDPKAPVLFKNVKIYDAETNGFKKKQSVLVDGATIKAVGRGARSKDARIIDGKGMTLVPGLWDMHYHTGGDGAGILALANGVTSVRDIGNEKATLLKRMKRIRDGELLAPSTYAILGMDGDGPLSAQGFVRIHSVEEGVRELGLAKEEGFLGVKLYGTIDPAWVKPLADEAHRLGMSVQGHIPAGMRPSQAVAAGYDGVNHINFIAMDAMPDDVVKTSNGLNRFFGPGKHAQHIDLADEPMESFIATLATRKTVVDPTLTVYEGSFVPEAGELAPGSAPYLGIVPAQVERAFKTGGMVAPEGYDTTRADMRASFEKLVEIVRVLHEKGVPIVAGTDGYPMDLIREMELYVRAGMTNGEALETATDGAARALGLGDKVGRIAPGQAADLVLVQGDVEQSIGALRHVVTVMQGGLLMDGAKLREAAGFSGAPK